MQLPDVILLNGCSCAGKSSLALALQDRLPEPFMRMSLDEFVIQQSPLRWIGAPDGFLFVPQADGSVEVQMGKGVRAVQRAFHRSVRVCVEVGLRVVVDEVLIDPELLPDWMEALSGADVFFVGVHCDLAELEMRERARPDRTNGVSRSQFARVHAHGLYDLEIDTTSSPTSACAGQILAALESRPSPSAFERLAAR